MKHFLEITHTDCSLTRIPVIDRELSCRVSPSDDIKIVDENGGLITGQASSIGQNLRIVLADGTRIILEEFCRDGEAAACAGGIADVTNVSELELLQAIGSGRTGEVVEPINVKIETIDDRSFNGHLEGLAEVSMATDDGFLVRDTSSLNINLTAAYVAQAEDLPIDSSVDFALVDSPKTVEAIASDRQVTILLDGQGDGFVVKTAVGMGADVGLVRRSTVSLDNEVASSVVSVDDLPRDRTLGESEGDIAYLISETDFEGLDQGDTATVVFTYVVNADSDGLNSCTESETVTITVNGVNDVPELIYDVDMINAGTGYPGWEPAVGSSEGDGKDDDLLMVVEINGEPASGIVLLPSGAEVSVAADGTVDYNPGDIFDGLDETETAVDSFVYQISDGNGGTETATANITIDGAEKLVPSR